MVILFDNGKTIRTKETAQCCILSFLVSTISTAYTPQALQHFTLISVSSPVNFYICAELQFFHTSHYST